MDKKNNKLRLAVLLSGGGTNLQALIDRSAEGSLQAEVVVVASDNPNAYGLERAEKAGIPAHYVDHKAHGNKTLKTLQEDVQHQLKELDNEQQIIKHPDSQVRLDRLARRVSFEQELFHVLDSHQPDLICLAGFMRLVTPFFIQHYNGQSQWRILNIHPALLPAFPGQHGYEDTFSYGCKWGGVTVHFVDEGEDTGPVIAQAIYPIWPNDTLEDIQRRGLEQEYQVYAQCVNWIAQNSVEITKDTKNNRYRVQITDPSYKVILQGWMQKAFGI